MKRGPKIQNGVAVVRMRHLAKNFQPVEAPNQIYLRTKFQLSNSITLEIWNPLFAIGLTLAPEMVGCI